MRRQARLNSLLVEVLSETLRKDVKNPEVNAFTTITRVDITKDLKHAKVYFSVIGSEKDKQTTLNALQDAAGFIAAAAAKKVVMRYFPELTFYIDTSLEKQIRLQELFVKVKEEKESRDGKNNSI